MQLNDAFPSKYLKVEDLKKRKRVVEIESVEMEKIGDDKKMVVAFEGHEKRLVLNKTNAMTIASLLDTDETEDWVGRSITLIPSQTEFQGKPVKCIRVALDLPDEDMPPNKAKATKGHASAADREFEEEDVQVAF